MYYIIHHDTVLLTLLYEGYKKMAFPKLIFRLLYSLLVYQSSTFNRIDILCVLNATDKNILLISYQFYWWMNLVVSVQ